MIYTNIQTMEVGRMINIIFISIVSLCFLAIIWCITAFFWLRKIHKRYEEQISKPWDALIKRIESRTISIEEGNKLNSIFMELSNLSLKEYGRFSPIYIFKHWNDQYSEEWLRERGKP